MKMHGELALRKLLSPLRDAAVIDACLVRVPAIRDSSAREVASRVVGARVKASDEGVALVRALREVPEEFLGPRDRDGERARESAAIRTASTSLRSAADALGAKLAEERTFGTGTYQLDGRVEGGSKYAVQGTLKGTSTRSGDLIVRFWNLWGGSNVCRKVMTSSARDSIYRSPERLEAAVLKLDELAPFIDSPLLLHREPLLLAIETEELIRRLVRLRRIFPRGDLGHACTGAPALLLAEPESLERAVNKVKRERNLSSSSAVMKCVTELVQGDGIDSLLAHDDAYVDIVENDASAKAVVVA